jgi:mevalonate pyrophosphate decarboxylase
MGALELRDSVLEYINTADERLLKVVKAVIESYQENDVVVYTIDGLPMTRIAYKEELHEAIAEIKRGEYTAQEDVENESKDW